ncbi:hypothetical protein B0T10DRAFT_212076 [Thelonectria olida]|uniref:Ring-like domain-containing protein n=1 Tax=Thelonectria olida TaxID=1576542 RepID=A0A9P8WE07_9HYPO|nr:hypothetical protein B0T10DRAFT_212076 [Thelonectria olida]
MLEYFKSKTSKKKVDQDPVPEVETTGDKPLTAEIKTVADDKHHEEHHEEHHERHHEWLHQPHRQLTRRDSQGVSIMSQSDRESRSSVDQIPVSPVLDRDDEAWLQSILDDDSPPPPLPPRVKTPHIELSDSDSASGIKRSTEVAKSDGEDELKNKDKETPKEKKKREKQEKKEKKEKEKKDKKDKEKKEKEDKGKDKEHDEQHHNRLTLLFSRNKKNDDTLKPEDAAITPQEAEREKEELGSVLDRLNLKAKNNKVISMSDDSSDLLQNFTQVFKDLVNGVPTAYGDLTKLFEDREGTLNKGFEKLPSSLQKLVTQLPEKLTSSLAPELLAVAAESQGLKAETEKGVKDAAMKLLTPQNLTELVTKPGAMVSMLKAIVNALKLRWPAVMGTNVVWSVALFLLMFVLWYCHKRGREVRLEKQRSDAEAGIDDGDRIEELPDDPLLPAPQASSSAAANVDEAPRAITQEPADPVSPLDLPHPPIGRDAPANLSHA